MFKNLTPHSITIYLSTGDHVVIPPSGDVARVSSNEETLQDVFGVRVVRRTFGEVIGLPEEGVPCIVSGFVAAAVPGRAGVYAPDTGPTAVRMDGQVVAVTGLIAA